jgi:hypothetical protein
MTSRKVGATRVSKFPCYFGRLSRKHRAPQQLYRARMGSKQIIAINAAIATTKSLPTYWARLTIATAASAKKKKTRRISARNPSLSDDLLGAISVSLPPRLISSGVPLLEWACSNLSSKNRTPCRLAYSPTLAPWTNRILKDLFPPARALGSSKERARGTAKILLVLSFLEPLAQLRSASNLSLHGGKGITRGERSPPAFPDFRRCEARGG